MNYDNVFRAACSFPWFAINKLWDSVVCPKSNTQKMTVMVKMVVKVKIGINKNIQARVDGSFVNSQTVNLWSMKVFFWLNKHD